MNDAILGKMDAMYKAMVADRDAWKAKAEKYREMLRLEHQHCDPDCSVCAALEEDTP